MAKTKLVVFDLDGTIQQTDRFAVPAHQRAQKEMGVTVQTAEEIISHFGEWGEETAKFYLGTDDPVLIRQYLDYESQFEKLYIDEYDRPFDGMVDSLEKLRAAGYRVAICSNASERYIRMCVGALGIDALIDEIQPLADGIVCKDDSLRLLLERIKPDAAVMVGDRHFDWDAAVANEIPFIGCAYGFVPAEVENAPCAVQSAAEVFDAVERLIG